MKRLHLIALVALAISTVSLTVGYVRLRQQSIRVKDFTAFPDTIDLGSIGPGCVHEDDPGRYNAGLFAFDGAPEIGSLVVALKHQYHLDVAVETGTYMGDTTAFLGNLFPEVHTAEVNAEFHAKASQKLKPFPNVTVHLASSEKMLAELLPTLAGKRAFFYLDAHWNDYWPLLDELKVIAKTHKDQAVILIDDAKYPHDSTIGFDAYGTKELSAEYIHEALKDLYSAYELKYVVAHDPWETRVKILLLPKTP